MHAQVEYNQMPKISSLIFIYYIKAQKIPD